KCSWYGVAWFPHGFDEIIRDASECNRTELKSIPCYQHSKGCFAESESVFEHRIKNWREVAGGGVDDLENLGSRGLLLQGLTGLANEARVLDGDDGLIGECLDQIKLAVGERARTFSAQRK